MIYDLQKASMMKRFSAFLLDFILLIILTTGFMWLISTVTGYADYTTAISDKMSEIEAKHNLPAITEEYKIDLNQYDILSAEEARIIHKLDRNDREREVKLILSIIQDKIINASNNGYSDTSYTFSNSTYNIEAVNTVTDILNIKGYSASRLTEKSLTGNTTISVSWSIRVESVKWE